MKSRGLGILLAGIALWAGGGAISAPLAQADVTQATSAGVQPSSTTTLIADDGSQVAVPVTRHIQSITVAGRTELSDTSAVSLELQGNDLIPYDSKQDCQLDSTRGVNACITQNFYLETVGGLIYADVESYVDKWVRIDSTIRWSGATMTAAVSGKTPTGTQIDKTETKAIGAPTGGANYTQVPSWHGQYTLVVGVGRYQCGTSHIDLYHGTTHWVLNHRNVCQKD